MKPGRTVNPEFAYSRRRDILNDAVLDEYLDILLGRFSAAVDQHVCLIDFHFAPSILRTRRFITTLPSRDR